MKWLYKIYGYIKRLSLEVEGDGKILKSKGRKNLKIEGRNVGLLFSSPFPFSQIAGGGQQQQQQHAHAALYLDDDDNFLATFL